MNFKYSDYFGAAPPPDYETLLLDCMVGDPTLFQRDDMVEAGWRVVEPILDAWRQLRRPTSRTTQPAQPDRARPTSCSNATAANGETSEDDIAA